MRSLQKNKYSVSKTISFELKPEGNTEKIIQERRIIETDKERARAAEEVKKYIDRYNKYVIEQVLNSLFLDEIPEYASLYYKKNKNAEEIKEIEEVEDQIRKKVSDAFKNSIYFDDLFGKEIIKNKLPEFLTEEEEIKNVLMFARFSTYFKKFQNTRRHIYSDENKENTIGKRITDNLHRFLDNAKIFEKVKAALPEEVLKELDDDVYSLNGINTEDIFQVDYFSFAMSRSGIDKYNRVLGGYSCSDGTKVKGLNEYINLYNQQVNKNERIPKIKPLYKQILSDKESLSFIDEQFEDDREILDKLNEYFKNIIFPALVSIEDILSEKDSFDTSGIFYKAGKDVTQLSLNMCENWDTIKNNWYEEYKKVVPRNKKSNEKYYEAVQKAYKAIKSFSLQELSELTGSNAAAYIENSVKERINSIKTAYKNAEILLSTPYTDYKRLANNEDAVELIKVLVEETDELRRTLAPLCGSSLEDNKDEIFYGKFYSVYENLISVKNIYNRTKNYLTKKPCSKEKLALSFNKPEFLDNLTGSWDGMKANILKKDENNFFLIVNAEKLSEKDIEKIMTTSGTETAERIHIDFQKPDNKNLPRMFIYSKAGKYSPAVSEYQLPVKDIEELYLNGWFKTAFKEKDPVKFKESLTKLIDYFKDALLVHPLYKNFKYEWKESFEYKDISEFYNDTQKACYNVNFEQVNMTYIRQLVEEGKIYLFRITNRDMSEYNKGTPSMFTKYFRMLFSKENDGTYKLNGEAEMFFRDKLIRDSERVIHPAGQPIMNKNPYNSKKESVFVYDIIKDKHYTEHKYLLHMSFTGNFKADGQSNINSLILEEVRNDKCNNIIGIDRGENNLLYVSVINEDGKILEQHSLNSFVSGNGIKVDYQELLKKKEKERDAARKNWQQINSIACLKEGYLSCAVKAITDLAVKYKAIIVMEDLSVPFMDCRAAIETQVYKKAETSLKNKLSFLIDKDTPDDEKGGLMHPYQLVCKPGDSITGIQNGALFKVNAWKTSKIDPVTGFSDLIYMKYSSIESSSQMFKLFDDIFYDSQEDLFVFRTDYSKFPRARISSTKYDICTYGDRIERYRDPDNIYHWCTRKIFLTEEFKKLFKEYKIDYRTNLKKQITEQQTATFFKRIIKLYQLTVQVRNSVSGSNKREDDYIISPVKGYDGKFFDSRYCDNTLPQDADANGAYNIARKGLILVKKMKEGGEKPNLSISSKEWLEFANLGLNIK